MAVQAINAISGSGSNPTNDGAPISLNTRVSNAQKVATQSEDPAGIFADPNLPDLCAWLFAFKDSLTTEAGRLELSKMLESKIASYRNESNTGPAYNGMTKMLNVVTALQQKFEGDGLPEMSDFLTVKIRELNIRNVMLSPIVQRALSPTVENGGKAVYMDEDDDPFEQSMGI